MKTTHCKRISAVIACILSVAMLATACEKTGESTAGIPEIETTVSTAAESVSETTAEETTTVTEETTTVSEETTAETEETTVSETSETTASESSETSETAQEWSETELSGTKYITEKCYSREKAIIGATPISQYYPGDTVEVTALTDTGYYKLATGGFIHSDYISDEKPAETTAPQTEAPETTTAAPETSASKTTETEFKDPADQSSTDSSSSSGSSGGAAIETPNYNIKTSSRYAYKQLSSAEQKLYDNLVTAIKKLDSKADVPDGLTSDQVIKVYTIVYDSEPQLFWMDSSISPNNRSLSLTYKTTDRNEIKSMQKEIDTAANNILNKANKYSGTVSKLKVFFDSIVLQSEFSMSSSGYNSTVYNGFTAKGELQCAGYAKTMQYLCDMAGIECCVVRGSDKEGGSHAWNVVYCENGYYNLDATWGDPINKFGSNYAQYEFFLVPDAWIHNKTHYNVSTLLRKSGSVKLFNPPSCTKEACNYFAAYSKLYDNASDAEKGMYAAIDDALANGKNVAQIRVSSQADYELLTSTDYFKKFQKYAKDKSSSVKQLEKKGSYTAGVQVVHYDIVYN